ncbi:hypothetical protein RhiirC2_775610 [Rhizophagus irregularis]|uniref:Uncharacterized protein n=1 Tax=Rhizophagus irregularis TaxID=588596 RepID=A0A2N1NIQ3_9GLOM|nr:hypothetical protein RhiirC2_775610 [Rhizophagus irregularis]
MKKLLPKLNVNQKNPNENFVNPKVIKDITSNMKDKDLTRLFENCCPNTLGVIHVQAELIISDSYANAYYASPKSRLPHPKNPWSKHFLQSNTKDDRYLTNKFG